jgi:hypothetical protein
VIPSAADASLAENVQVTALHGVTFQSCGDLRRRRAQRRDRAVPPACPVPVVAGQQAGPAPPFTARPGRQLTVGRATRTPGHDAALAIQNPRSIHEPLPSNVARLGKPARQAAALHRKGNGGAHGRSGHLPAGARAGDCRSRAGSSIQPQRRPTRACLQALESLLRLAPWAGKR